MTIRRLFLWAIVAVLPFLTMFAAKMLVSTLIALTLVLFSAHPSHKLRNLFLCPGPHRFLIAFMIWGFLSVLWSINLTDSLFSALGITLLSVCGAALALAQREEPSLPLSSWRGFAFCAIATSFLLTLESQPTGGPLFWLSHQLAAMDYPRFFGKTLNRGLCAMAVLVWPVFSILWAKGERVLGIAMLVAVGSCIMAFQSLSAQLGFIVGVLVMLLIYGAPLLASRLFLLVPVIFVLTPLVVYCVFHAQALAWTLPYLVNMSDGRIPIWREIVGILQGHEWLGYGLGVTPEIQFTPDAITRMGLHANPLHAHNTPLQLMLETGLVGLALFTTFLATYFLRARRGPGSALTLVEPGLLITYLATGAFAFGFCQTWWVATFWLAQWLWRAGVPAPQSA